MNNSLLKIYAKDAWIMIFKNVKLTSKLSFAEVDGGVSDDFYQSHELPWVCLSVSQAYFASKPFESLQPNQFAANCFLVMESRMARYQFQVYDLDEFYMIFVRYWKWKFDGCTSGFCFDKLWLTLCMFGVWEWFLSLGCFGDVWVVQTTFIWYLESVWCITLIRNDKVWKLSF